MLVEGSFKVKSGVESDSQVGAICLAGYCVHVHTWYLRSVSNAVNIVNRSHSPV